LSRLLAGSCRRCARSRGRAARRLIGQMTRIAVTGLGAATAFGAGVDALWAGVVEGRRAMATRPELATWTASPVALAPKLAFDAHGRTGTLATLAVEEALADAGGLRDLSRARLAVTVGTTLGSIDNWL